jgi:hypothetical protein
LIEAGSEIRVVARIKPAVNVVTPFEERRRPTPKSCCRHYRIYQLEPRASVEGASLACFGVDGDHHQSLFGPSLSGKLCGNGFPPVPAARTCDPQRQRSDSPENGGGLDRVRRAAKGDRKLRFTALLHHVTVEQLRSSYHQLKKGAAPGVDGSVVLDKHR